MSREGFCTFIILPKRSQSTTVQQLCTRQLY